MDVDALYHVHALEASHPAHTPEGETPTSHVIIPTAVGGTVVVAGAVQRVTRIVLLHARVHPFEESSVLVPGDALPVTNAEDTVDVVGLGLLLIPSALADPGAALTLARVHDPVPHLILRIHDIAGVEAVLALLAEGGVTVVMISEIAGRDHQKISSNT